VGRHARRRPVREHYRADQVAAGHRSPRAGVAGVNSVIAEDEVVARRDARPATVLVSSPRGIEIGLDETVAVDVDDAVAFRYQFTGKSDDALDESRAGVIRFASFSASGGFENDDLDALGTTEPVRKPVGDHTVVEAPLAEVGGVRAVERWLHRGRRDDVRLAETPLVLVVGCKVVARTLRRFDPRRLRDAENVRAFPLQFEAPPNEGR
jgi:hypothetical protein